MAQIVKYSTDDGKTISTKRVKMFFASSSKYPSIEIIIASNNTTETALRISAKEILSLIFSRLIEHLSDERGE